MLLQQARGFIFLLVAGCGSAFTTLGCSEDYYRSPQCKDHPDGYSCDCGPGYFWNTASCVATGLDSYMEFTEVFPARYTILEGKPIPMLRQFSICFWIRKAGNSSEEGTILSYSLAEQTNIFAVSSDSNGLRLRLFGSEVVSGLPMNATAWTHVVWTWRSRDGSWTVFINGGSHTLNGKASSAARSVPGNGELVLGQTGRRGGEEFDSNSAFVGDLSAVHVWGHVLDQEDAIQVYEDCELRWCGDVAQWADFRSGTRGPLRIRWPSGIHSDCIPRDLTTLSCDHFCSVQEGPRCNAGIVGNTVWGRTPAASKAIVPCPGSRQTSDTKPQGTEGALAYRECHVTSAGLMGRWAEPVLDACVDQAYLNASKQVDAISEEHFHNKSLLIEALADLVNLTGEDVHSNVMDLAVIINTLQTMIVLQKAIVNNLMRSASFRLYGLNRQRDQQIYPSEEQSHAFMKDTCDVVDNVLSENYMSGWRGMLPPGSLGDQLIQAWETFVNLVYSSVRVSAKRTAYPVNTVILSKRKIAYSMQAYKLTKEIHMNCATPQDSLLAFGPPRITLISSDVGYNVTSNANKFLSCTWIIAPMLLPNHNVTNNSSEDNVNSPLLFISQHPSQSLNNSAVNLTSALPYINNFNISNPECVQLLHGDKDNIWSWTKAHCTLESSNSTHAICSCRGFSTVAVTTDMYDINWNSGQKPPSLLGAPSYVGCSVAALLSLATLFMLIYFRTTTKTSSLHKHFAAAVFCSQMTLMLGIDKIHSQAMCQVFAIAFHYFFLTEFLWLMNEAFNLYIVITYAAHSHGEHAEGGSKWRYYILGWALPCVMVGAFLGTHKHDYYAADMCLINWRLIWLFMGPAIGIVSVTVLVLIFTAKEHHESSYSKNEQTNKTIVIYSRALWTQIILILLSWFFGFMSIRMRATLIKWLYALFNILQGLFFFVFFLVLNDEVQAVYKKKAKTLHGRYDDDDDDDMSSTSSLEQALYSPGTLHRPVRKLLSHNTQTSCVMETPVRSHVEVRLRQRSRVDSSSCDTDDDDDDCQSDVNMMVTSV